MAETIALVGALGLALGGTGLFGKPSRMLGMSRAQAAAFAILGALGLLTGGLIFVIERPPGPAPLPASAEVHRRLQSTLRAYLSSNAPEEASLVRSYALGSDWDDLVVRTELAPAHHSLQAGQRICELARNVIVQVRVVAIEGSTLWSCDRVNSEGNAQLVLAEQQAAAEAEAERLAEEQARAADEAQAASQLRTRRTTAQPARTSSRSAVPAPAAAPGPDCHPSYVGECLPPDASDVDCVGGRGNGPVYAVVEDISVVGPDEYGLDRDDDKVACESNDRDDGLEADLEPMPAPEPDDEAEPPPAQAICHPSYEGECLPVDASDVDCVDGDGNGPVYAQNHNIRVVGPDIYGLDSDGDGLGCEP